VLRPSDRAPGLLVGEGVQLPDDIELGANVVIHAGVALAAGVRIQDAAIVGKALVVGRRSQARLRGHERTFIGEGATIAAGAVVVAGAAIDAGAFIGDQAHVRERAVVGGNSAVGRGTAVDNDVVVGERVRIQTGCYITAFSRVEDDVFVGPGVYTFNDNVMGRHAKGAPLSGPTLRRASRIGGGAMILPGIEIGEEAFVATGSVVTRDVPPRTLVMGSPAKFVREIGAEELIENWR
jgi:UDP-2-acetamido-3-amino-2,3-dideoxy-glucuronate N-acetyltransferase